MYYYINIKVPCGHTHNWLVLVVLCDRGRVDALLDGVALVNVSRGAVDRVGLGLELGQPNTRCLAGEI